MSRAEFTTGRLSNYRELQGIEEVQRDVVTIQVVLLNFSAEGFWTYSQNAITLDEGLAPLRTDQVKGTSIYCKNSKLFKLQLKQQNMFKLIQVELATSNSLLNTS